MGRGSPHGSQWEVRWYFASVHLAITCLTAEPPQKILASWRTRFQISACVFLVYHRSRERGKISVTFASVFGTSLVEGLFFEGAQARERGIAAAKARKEQQLR